MALLYFYHVVEIAPCFLAIPPVFGVDFYPIKTPRFKPKSPGVPGFCPNFRTGRFLLCGLEAALSVTTLGMQIAQLPQVFRTAPWWPIAQWLLVGWLVGLVVLPGVEVEKTGPEPVEFTEKKSR